MQLGTLGCVLLAFAFCVKPMLSRCCCNHGPFLILPQEFADLNEVPTVDKLAERLVQVCVLGGGRVGTCGFV